MLGVHLKDADRRYQAAPRLAQVEPKMGTLQGNDLYHATDIGRLNLEQSAHAGGQS
jgi:hypothetical protein